MPAPLSDLSSSSISSSGHTDGLGRRSLAFDRETGAMLERVYARPELAVFEQVLRARVHRLKTLEDERFARPLAVERDASSGELYVLAEFVIGNRLSDLLEVSSDAAVVPGVDVALGYLVETLSGLTMLHTTTRAVHGLIDPSRTVITVDGQVVLVDLAFGPVVELLHPSIERLWSEFGIASMARDDRFNVVGDITQAGLNALMLVLGRNLKPHEFPEAIPSLLMEVIEVAHIRGSAAFAAGLQRLLQRSLPLPGRRPYESAAEALGDVQQLVRREIGADVCRQAVADFVAQMDAAFMQATEREAAAAEARARRTPRAPELDSLLDSFETVDEASAVEDEHQPLATRAALDDDEEEGGELEISLDQIDGDAAAPSADGSPQAKRDEEIDVYDLQTLDDFASATSDTISSELKPFESASVSPAASAGTERMSTAAPGPGSPPAPRFAPPPERAPEPAPPPAPAQAAPSGPVVAAPAPLPSPTIAAPADEPRNDETMPTPAANFGEEPEDDFAAPAPGGATESDRTQGSSRRRKRQQQKSARARKDKLRSTTADQKGPSAAPPTPPARPANQSGWLVSPQRAAASESLIPPPVQPPPPPPAPAMPSFSPSPVGAFPQPSYANTTPPSVYGTPTVIKPAPPPPPPPPPPLPPAPPVARVQPSSLGTVQPSSFAVQPSSLGSVQPSPTATVQPSSLGAVQPSAATVQASPRTPLKLKEEPPAVSPARRMVSEPVAPPPDRFSMLSLRADAQEEPKAFPWKLAAVAVAVAIIAIVAGRAYLPGRLAVEGEPGAPSEAPGATPPATSRPLDDGSPIPEGKGRVLVATQPAGVKVIVDKKTVGDTPLRLDLPPGRRTLTFLTSGGEVTQTVRVVAGKTVTLDIPVFSGWVSVIAPFVLDIAEEGRHIGTTEQNRIMLPPGRHTLTFSHKEFGYSSTHDVDVEPGGVRTVTVNPKGTAAINATPWAEVWLDGTKLGETPLASTPVPLGTHEFVFKHPELGERRVTATIRGSGTSTVSADFSK